MLAPSLFDLVKNLLDFTLLMRERFLSGEILDALRVVIVLFGYGSFCEPLKACKLKVIFALEVFMLSTIGVLKAAALFFNRAQSLFLCRIAALAYSMEIKVAATAARLLTCGAMHSANFDFKAGLFKRDVGEKRIKVAALNSIHERAPGDD